MKQIQSYQCEICGTMHRTPESALQCEAKGSGVIRFKHGDFVITDGESGYGRFGWYDGDPEWVLGRKTGHHSKKDWSKPSYTLIYVVMFVDFRDHDVRYHLATKGMARNNGYSAGWTVERTHLKLTPFTPATDLDASDLIGCRASKLL